MTSLNPRAAHCGDVYLMRKLDYPLAPAVLALVLGAEAEPALRQSLLISDGSFMIFFQRPLSALFLAIAIAMFTLPLVKIMRSKMPAPAVATAAVNSRRPRGGGIPRDLAE